MQRNGPRALSVEGRFLKELLGLPRDEQKKVVRTLADLQRDPMHSSTPLKGFSGIFRCRVDPFRLLFTTSDGWLHVYSVQHRRSVYQGEIASPRSLPTRNAPEWPASPANDEEQSDHGHEPEPEESPTFDWDALARLVVSRDAEDLYELIGLGLPEPLFDELFAHLTTTPRDAGPVNVRLIHERVIDEFYGRLLLLPQRPNPVELTLVTPWLTPWDGPKSSFSAVLSFLRSRRIETTLITRPPQLPRHRRCVDELSQLPNVEVVQLEDLHAKYFVCDMAPTPFALVGSANMTAQSFANYEVGVFIRGSGLAEGIIRDLQALAVQLRAAGKRTKRRAYA